MQHVVAGGVPTDLGEHLLAAGTEVVLVDAALDELADLEVVGGDSVLKETGVDGVGQRLDQVQRLPALILVHPHDAVAEVVVLADDVGIGVVEFVVGVLPHIRR